LENAEWDNEIPRGHGKLVLEQTGKTHIVEGKKIKSRKPTSNKWFEIQDSIGYWDDFSKQKIVWADIATEPTFVLMNEHTFFNNTCYMITGAPTGLVDILNSKLVGWYFPKIATDIGNGGARYFKQFVELLQIPKTIENRNYTDQEVFDIYRLSEEEIGFIESQ